MLAATSPCRDASQSRPPVVAAPRRLAGQDERRRASCVRRSGAKPSRHAAARDAAHRGAPSSRRNREAGQEHRCERRTPHPAMMTRRAPRARPPPPRLPPAVHRARRSRCSATRCCPIALAFAVLDGLDGSPARARARARRAGRADDVPRPRRGRLGRPHVAPPAMLVSDLGRAVVQAVTAVAAARRQRRAVAPDRAVGGLRRARGVLPPRRRRPHARRSSRRGELQQANALVGLAQNVGHVLGPAAAGALIVVISPGAAHRRRRRDVRRQRRVPARAARAAARAAPGRARPALLAPSSRAGSPRSARAAGCSASCPPSPPTTSIALPCVLAPRRGARRPGARRRGRVGDHHLLLRRGHDRSAR